MDTPQTLLFFGTFNPPTLGHAFVIEQALSIFSDSQLWIIPADKPIWDKKGVVSFEHRRKMLELLIQDLDPSFRKSISIEDIEHTQHLSGKTQETLSLLQKDHPNNTFRIVMGADSFATFDRWYEWKEILNEVEISVIPRADLFTQAELLKHVSPQLQTVIGNKVVVHEIPDKKERWFSSTQTKEDIVLLGHTIQVSEPIFHYIKEHSLYENT